MSVDRDEIFARLREPFTDIKWRLQQTSPKDAKVNGRYQPGTKGLFMAYIDARQLYDRLDDVIGFGNWERIVAAVNADGSVIGRLRIRIGDEWITHEDIGYPNNPGAGHETEPLKAAASDAFKRAGVGLGVGRFLYDLDADWKPIDEWGKPIGGNRGNAPVASPDGPGATFPDRSKSTTVNTVTGENETYPSGVTKKQIAMIGRTAEEKGVTPEQVKAMHGKESATLLTKPEASALIERLLALPTEEQGSLADMARADRYTS